MVVRGKVNSAHRMGEQRLALDVYVESAPPVCQALVGGRLRLHWYTYAQTTPPQAVGPGSLLTATVRLKPPWGNKNPGAFDYRRWLLGKGYVATGYIREGRITLLRLKRSSLVGDYVFGGLLAALLFGDQSAISEAQWALFRRTGTVHLMVVSGLHVGVFSGLAYLVAYPVVHFLLLVLRIKSRIPASTMAMWVGLVFTLGFALFSGAQAPVMRAVSMSAGVVLLVTTLRSPANWLRVLLLIALLTLIAVPRFVFQQGFWLSYLAVALLLVGFAYRKRRQSAVRAMLYGQLLLFFGFTPWVGYLAGAAPLISLFANLLVVPVMTLFALPVALCGWFLALMGFNSYGLLKAADLSLAVVMELLSYLDELDLPVLGPFSLWQALIGSSAVLVSLLPVSIKFKMVCSLAYLSLLMPKTIDLAPGQFRVTVLDVGQGSAALVDTRRHRLLVDAGIRIDGGFDAGQAVVLPALRALGPDRLDAVLLSHEDLDHAGGLKAVQQRFPDVAEYGTDGHCLRNEWIWDDVVMRILSYPGGKTRNDRSCTLLIVGRHSTAFLSGDIAAASEWHLISELPTRIDLLVAPHHGSATSSSAAFVTHLSPRVVVFSAGRFNRYQHPRAEVVARYELQGARIFVTGLDGAVVWTSGKIPYVTAQR